jgi:adenylate cyclase class 2
MTYEVELKFPLAEPAAVTARLNALGAVAGPAIEQRDVYYNHPQRDFAQTNEALRIRTVGPQNWITYKGPLIDTQTKTRRELEVGFSDGPEAARDLAELWQTLGFRQVRTVDKRRIPFHLGWRGRDWEVVLDEVAGLGNFLEIETLADESERDAARDALLELAKELQLAGAERRSYLEMLLEKEGRR